MKIISIFFQTMKLYIIFQSLKAEVEYTDYYSVDACGVKYINPINISRY